ncbi:pirin family protein [Robiginitalea sp. IMCC44478]|uniref:pirin family protein n=1 Tax=Robiginitalea sp. IMCC44478 TaxID=3459122 RepID=UPI0040433D82
MKKELHPATSRGRADHGWLKSHHSFSFANYYNPERMHFGVLRVLNDDWVAPGMGFGTHPHQNMEIISIPLEGNLEHKDSMGNTAVIRQGDVQVMSAGTGVRHSEYNKNREKAVAFLQIWIIPDTANVSPRYDQISLDPSDLKNNWHTLLGPKDKHSGLWIHQQAWFHLGQFDADTEHSYSIRESGNGLYVFVLNGNVQVGGEQLGKRDALGIWETSEVLFQFGEKSEVLLMEVPMSN